MSINWEINYYVQFENLQIYVRNEFINFFLWFTENSLWIIWIASLENIVYSRIILFRIVTFQNEILIFLKIWTHNVKFRIYIKYLLCITASSKVLLSAPSHGNISGISDSIRLINLPHSHIKITLNLLNWSIFLYWNSCESVKEHEIGFLKWLRTKLFKIYIWGERSDCVLFMVYHFYQAIQKNSYKTQNVEYCHKTTCSCSVDSNWDIVVKGVDFF